MEKKSKNFFQEEQVIKIQKFIRKWLVAKVILQTQKEF